MTISNNLPVSFADAHNTEGQTAGQFPRLLMAKVSSEALAAYHYNFCLSKTVNEALLCHRTQPHPLPDVHAVRPREIPISQPCANYYCYSQSTGSVHVYVNKRTVYKLEIFLLLNGFLSQHRFWISKDNLRTDSTHTYTHFSKCIESSSLRLILQ